MTSSRRSFLQLSSTALMTGALSRNSAYPAAQVLKFYAVPLDRIVAGKNTVKISNLDRKKDSCDLRSMELALYR